MRNESQGQKRGMRSLAAGCSVFVVLWPLVVLATDPAPSPAKEPRKGKPKPMSRDQLRTCMNLQDQVKAMREDLLKQQASLEEQRKEVGRMDVELERQRAALDPADAVAAQALAEAEAKRNVVSDAFNARLPTARDLNTSYNGERHRWVEQCADKDYDANDEAAIKRERQRAAKAGTPAK